MLRPLLPDVPDDDMCGVIVGQVFPANEKWHPLLMQALTGSSPNDFPAEHYERAWTNRFQLHDLNDIGRRGLGLD